MLEESGMHEREGERPRCDDAAKARFLAALFVEVKPVELIQAAAIVLNLFSSHYSRVDSNKTEPISSSNSF